MAQTLARSNTKRINPQQLAWGVMLLAFAAFCVIIVIAVVGVQYFLFQSRVPIQSTIAVARGTASLVDIDLNQTAVTTVDTMGYGAVLTTDPQSQAAITFVDSQDSNNLVASITVENGSSLTLKQDSRPRFEWSSDAYWIDFKDVYGEFDIFVPDPIARGILISFTTTLGPSVRLTASGHYTLIAAGQQVQVVNYSGEALLIAPDSRNQLVPAGQTASIQAGTDNFALMPHPDLLGDAMFSAGNVLNYDTNANSDQAQAQAWLCNNTVDNPNEAAGTVGLSIVDGRPALRLYRDDNAQSHGISLCWHGLGTGMGGLDVSSFASVSIRATFMIHSQSVSACGVDASECPVMLAMDYIPVNDGQPRKWFHGFYAFSDPNRVFPLRCDNCSEQHEQINHDVWYTYESHNLFQTFLPDSLPKTILNLRFYASGHEYDVYVSQVVLLADQEEIPLISGG